MCVVFSLAPLIWRCLYVFELAVISLAVDVRFLDVIDFESHAAPTCKPAHRLDGSRCTTGQAHLRNLHGSCANDKNSGESNVYGILNHHHVCQKHSLGEYET